MKFLKKATLAAAVAVAPFAAQAELKALDDAMMSATTGQAGVTIDMQLAAGTGNSAAIRVGEVVYEDQGQVSINNVQVGTATGVTIRQTVDVNTDGSLVIVAGGAVTSGGAADNGIANNGIGDIAGLNVKLGAVNLQDSTGAQVGSSLVASANLNVDLGESVTTIRGGIAADTFLNDAGNEGDYTVIDQTSSLKLTSSGAKGSDTSSEISALGGNVGLVGLTFDDNGNNATISQKIWANSAGLNIKLESITGDLTVGAIELGGNSIGSVTVSDIVMAGVTQKIYGH